MTLEDLQHDPYHYVPFMTGLEKNQPFMAICGRDVTEGCFYVELRAFLGMPLVVPIRRCPECEDLTAAWIGGSVAAVCAALSRSSREEPRRPWTRSVERASSQVNDLATART